MHHADFIGRRIIDDDDLIYYDDDIVPCHWIQLRNHPATSSYFLPAIIIFVCK